MAMMEISTQKTSRSFTTSLASAFLEWLLMFMLFIDALFAFIITKCARYWKLTSPCLLCSRLDHVFNSEKKGYQWDLICRNHKSEISSLVLCHAHNKLVDVHGMCESCLFSFATINKSNAETYRLLVGKLGEDPFSSLDEDPLLADQSYSFANRRHCACCNEPWVSKVHSHKLIQTKSIGSEVTDIEDDFKDKLFVSVRATHLKKRGVDHLPHVGYKELKISSDTESEVSFSDDDDDNASLLPARTDSVQCLTIQSTQIEPRIVSLGDELVSEKLIEPEFISEPSLLVTDVQKEEIQSHGDESAAFDVSVGHGLEELNWQQAGRIDDTPAQTDLISLDNPPAQTDLISLDNPPAQTDLISLDNPPAQTVPSNTTETSVEVLEESFDVITPDGCEKETGETYKTRSMTVSPSEIGVEAAIPVPADAGQIIPNILELGDAYKLALGSRLGRQLSGLLGEQVVGKDLSRVSEDLRLLFTQLSANRGIDQSLTDMSPRVPANGDELRISDASHAVGLHLLQRRISLERNESGLESLDGSIVSDIEGESAVDRLKRQIEHDKKIMSCLYKELEEERNASAIATNQAMAMITRLQEEKAAVHMEALQCVRMMEEQTEYDNEALQKANDLLAEKEKEIQDMEDELEYYRSHYPNQSVFDSFVETSETKARDIRVVHLESNFVEDDTTVHGNSSTRKPDMHDMDNVNNSVFDFEDERAYIMRSLKKLEKMLHLFSNNGVYLNLSNGGYFGNGPDDHCKVEPQDDERREDFKIQGHPSSLDSPQSDIETGELDCSRQTDLSLFGNEISNLNRRLEALEADKDFLEHTINSLRNEEMGLQFIQEIASHLRELRNIAIRGEQTVT